MTYKELKNIIKNEQKHRARLIRRGKLLCKLKNQHLITDDDRKVYGDYIWYKTKQISTEYRAIHVAYCQFFNKTPLDKIETKVRSCNQFDSRLHYRVYKEWEKLVEEQETVRTDTN